MDLKTRAQNIGSKLSGMVLPNLGAFLAWGIITALGIWLNSEMLNEFVTPMLNYLLPLLIAFAGGRMVYEYRGGVIGTVATMGTIISADVTMFIGAMIMGPVSAWLLKKFDEMIEDKIPTGFELLVNNFSAGILGAILAIIGYALVAPIVMSLTDVLASGVDFLVTRGLLPLTAIFIEPAKVLFLNNAIGQGILTPIGSTQLTEAGKSIMFLLEANPGPGLGILLAYMFYGKGTPKANAVGASFVHLFGGIHEIYFPFILMNPILVVSAIAGGIVGTFIFSIFNVGLVGVASPGSIITIMMMSGAGDRLAILLGVAVAAGVSFLVSIPLVKRKAVTDSNLEKATQEMEGMKGKESRISSLLSSSDTDTLSEVKNIAYACDAGLGSSAMGASVLKEKLNDVGLNEIEVDHMSISDLPADAEVVITQKSLMDRAMEAQGEAYFVGIDDFLNAPEYDELIEKILEEKN